MKNISLYPLFIFLFFFTNGVSQNITLDSARLLFPHPEKYGFNSPAIPFDYNEDQVTDFVIRTFRELFIYKGLGDGEFEIIDIVKNSRPEAVIKVMDVDGDEDIDIITKDNIYINQGEDEFSLANFQVRESEIIVDVSDFNGDGFNDILTLVDQVFFSTELSIHYFDSDTGIYSLKTISEEHDLGNIDIGDIEGDGDIDIVSAIPGAGKGIILLNEGEIFVDTFMNLSPFDRMGAESINLVDLDRDGDLDVVATDGFKGITLFENIDNFQTQVDGIDFQTGRKIFYLKMGDLNNDQESDIIVVTTKSNLFDFELHYLKNNGGFSFEEPVFLDDFSPSGNATERLHTPKNLSLFDYDFDGDLDLIFSHGHGNSPGVYLMENDLINPSTSYTQIERQAINIFPNPVGEHLYFLIEESVNFSDWSYQLLSSDGTILNLGVLNQDNSIDIASLPSGFYFLKLIEETEKALYLTSFIKE